MQVLDSIAFAYGTCLSIGADCEEEDAVEVQEEVLAPQTVLVVQKYTLLPLLMNSSFQLESMH